MDSVRGYSSDGHDKCNEIQARDALNQNSRNHFKQTADVIDLSAIHGDSGHARQENTVSVDKNSSRVIATVSSGGSNSPSSNLNADNKSTVMVSQFHRNRAGFW